MSARVSCPSRWLSPVTTHRLISNYPPSQNPDPSAALTADGAVGHRNWAFINLRLSTRSFISLTHDFIHFISSLWIVTLYSVLILNVPTYSLFDSTEFACEHFIFTSFLLFKIWTSVNLKIWSLWTLLDSLYDLDSNEIFYKLIYSL